MKKIFVSIAFTIMTMPVFCQKTYYDSSKTNFIYKNSVQFELGGYGGIYSVAYERTIFNKVNYKTMDFLIIVDKVNRYYAANI
jgi:hypothetical protein